MLSTSQREILHQSIEQCLDKGISKSGTYGIVRLAFVAWGIDEVLKEAKRYMVLKG